jgi:3-phytase
VPVPQPGDAADDPAIWLHPTDPAQSTILGTDKDGGLAVYDLAGNQLQYLPDGQLNNVDLRYNFPLGRHSVALVTASNRTPSAIALYHVNPMTRQLKPLATPITPGIEPYGLCMYHSRITGKYHVFVTSRAGAVEQGEVFATDVGQVTGRHVRSFSVGSKAEGCVADDALAQVYISEEAVGIWKYGAEPRRAPHVAWST